MNLRHLRYFVALAREKHHGRAAAACNVTQATLSEAIKQLEAELGVPLIDRGGPRFRALTPEGRRVLDWAQLMLADQDGLEQELAEMRQGLSGRLRLGVIPAAMPAAPLLITPFCARHPNVTVEVTSMTSVQIQRGLDGFDLEAGLTYLDNEPLPNVRSLPLYQERYVLLTAPSGPLGGRESVSWQEAAGLPLCLLSPDMQNRRIVDRIAREAGAPPLRPRMETTSMFAIMAHVRLGGWSSIVPHSALAVLGPGTDVRALQLDRPSVVHTVGLVASNRDPLSPLARAFLAAAGAIEVAAALEFRPADNRNRR
ncbi:MAG TPA: LysR family transcriptional regulator [Acetobacteraceae bacterium]|nr:LysR family transcriptional regulator [Acetobacteraceae bacterium]